MTAVRAYVGDNYMADGLNISLILTGTFRQILRLNPDGTRSYDVLDDSGISVPPTMILTHEDARALLDALLSRYEGASDMHTARADLLFERGRVDKLTSTLIGVVERRTR
jgi:hypothetical protein